MAEYMHRVRAFTPDMRRVLLAAAVVFVVWLGLLTVLYNLYLLRLGFDTRTVGLLAGLGALVWGLAALPAAALGNRLGLRNYDHPGDCRVWQRHRANAHGREPAADTVAGLAAWQPGRDQYRHRPGNRQRPALHDGGEQRLRAATRIRISGSAESACSFPRQRGSRCAAGFPGRHAARRQPGRRDSTNPSPTGWRSG